MDATWAWPLLLANLTANSALLVGALWCIAFPARRVYPMARPDVWYWAMWAGFALVLTSNPVFVVLDWNSGAFGNPLRFWLAGPLVAVGSLLVLSGIRVLGARRTSGLPQGLVDEGVYRLTRNPQYVGDALLFTGVALFANSGVVAVTHLLTAFVLLLAPFAEEPWLEAQYGDAYTTYRRCVPRYL